MIPPSGDFTVLGQVWDAQGNIFKCKLNSSSEDCTEYVEGTVIFLHKVKLSGDSPACKDASCRCTCHDSSCDEGLRDAADSLNESGFSSILEPDSSGKGLIQTGCDLYVIIIFVMRHKLLIAVIYS